MRDITFYELTDLFGAMIPCKFQLNCGTPQPGNVISKSHGVFIVIDNTYVGPMPNAGEWWETTIAGGTPHMLSVTPVRKIDATSVRPYNPRPDNCEVVHAGNFDLIYPWDVQSGQYYMLAGAERLRLRTEDPNLTYIMINRKPWKDSFTS